MAQESLCAACLNPLLCLLTLHQTFAYRVRQLEYAIVYNEMYGHYPSNMSPAIAEALPEARIVRETSFGYSANSLCMENEISQAQIQRLYSHAGTSDAAVAPVNVALWYFSWITKIYSHDVFVTMISRSPTFCSGKHRSSSSNVH